MFRNIVGLCDLYRNLCREQDQGEFRLLAQNTVYSLTNNARRETILKITIAAGIHKISNAAKNNNSWTMSDSANSDENRVIE